MANSLAAALAEFQVNPPVLTKNRAGQVGNQRTRYADLVQVNAQVLARLNQLEIIYTTAPTMLDDGKFVLQYELKHVPSGEVLGGRYPLKLSDNPQAMGSAITYARRYVLLALTGVAAEDEDDDGQAASGRAVAQRQHRQARPTARRASGAAPALPGEDKARGKMFALLREADLGDRDAGLAFIGEALARSVESTKDLTDGEVSTVIDRLTAYLEQSDPDVAAPGGGQDG